MTTLISVHNSSGLVGRCDAHCYDAREPDCTCICGGKNHGVGFKQAYDNVRAYTEEQIKDLQARGGMLTDAARQGTLL